jgi:DNA-directed RNA polymerase II subunit RPB2
MDESVIWNLIDVYFRDNPQSLVRHHIESYNDFFNNGIYRIFKEKNPITISSRFDPKLGKYKSQCKMYFGGKDGTKIYFGKPVIYDKNNTHYMFPNEARLRNMTYGMTVHYDIEVEFMDILEPGEAPTIIGGDFAEHVISGGIELGSDDDEDDDYDFDTGSGGGKPRNYKRGTSIDESKIDGTHTGGAPKPKLVKNTSEKYKMTPNIAALLKEASEKSVTEEGVLKQNVQRRVHTLERIYLGKIPIMVQSDYCILNGMSVDARFSVGECKSDLGGYFIIDGKEKTVVPQEKFGDNMLYIRKVSDDEYLYSAEMRSVSENVSKPVRTLSVKVVAPGSKFTNENIVVKIPNVRKPVPLFILFRALGIITDKQIITMCLLDINKYEGMMKLFVPSIHDAGNILTQHNAIKYIATLTKGKTEAYVMEILSDFLFPHIGEINFIQKAYYLGYIVFRLLSVQSGLEAPTDRDNFKYKRIELVGTLLSDLFREYYTIQQKEIYVEFEKKLYFNVGLYESNLFGLIDLNYKDVMKKRTLDDGFRKAFKGNWGAHTHTKRIGIIQDLNRLSYNGSIAHLRKTNLQMDSGTKIVEPHKLHASQWGFMDPMDTPDGGNVGLHKNLAISTHITLGISREPMIAWLREYINMRLIEECSPGILASMTKVFINGLWAGSVSPIENESPFDIANRIRRFRRNALIPIYISITFDTKLNTIFIYTDSGRLSRPIFYRDDVSGKISAEDKTVLESLKKRNYTWNDLISGFNIKKIKDFDPTKSMYYDLNELYEGTKDEKNPNKIDRFATKKGIIDYIDCSESENALIAFNSTTFHKDPHMKYTHCEIHESLILGVMCNQITFPENNQLPRNVFSCSQSKQACSVYHSNYQVRMDKTAVVLNYGQAPLVKSRYLKYINDAELPYGENAIVAIMCYTGYNVEDAILINEGALDRGLFRTTYYSSYEAREESSMVSDTTVNKRFNNIESHGNVVGTKPGFDYSKLDKFGLIRENTQVTDKTILIGMTTQSSDEKDRFSDNSSGPKKGQLGVVDKAFITEGDEGTRIAKIKIREQRIPNLGDKFASRNGQKGTIGMVVRECDMPFTKDGIRPDIIINPHAIPSRMTIGQLIESIVGKACASYGTFGECTAFANKGAKHGVFGELLTDVGFHSSGNELLYNGMTGEQIGAEIFMGPTYYMRLKHMVKDKINYRARGPRSALTKQPVGGRANDGGLRIGEMERDAVIGHGISEFLRESMMERGDKYSIAVCNKSGMVAIYNPSKNLFLSPMADGPVKFAGSVDGSTTNIKNITQFGRDFSVVSIPYSFKLLVQELQIMNIQLRIITEDNISHVENMGYSKNIETLLSTTGATPETIIQIVKQSLKSGNTGLTPTESELFPGTKISIPEPESDMSIYGGKKKSAPFNMSLHARDYLDAEELDIDLEESPELNVVENEFTVGDTVFLHGDSKPNRVWNISAIGVSFNTIRTNDNTGIDKELDMVRVVKPSEIYDSIRSVVGDESPFNVKQDMDESIDMNPFVREYVAPPTQSPAIVFSPTIRVVNGADHSQNTETIPPLPLPQEMRFDSEPNYPISPPRDDSTPSFPIKIRKESPSASFSSGASEPMDDSKIDFGKLQVSKIQ